MYPLKIEPIPGSKPGIVILRLIGPLTLKQRSSPCALCSAAPSRRAHTILDLSGVPFMDSAGMSEIINHEVYCRDKQVRLTLAGVTPRVLSMFHITRLEKILTLTATVEEAEATEPNFRSLLVSEPMAVVTIRKRKEFHASDHDLPADLRSSTQP